MCCFFSLAVFSICSLCLIFISFINMCLGVFCLVFILFETHSLGFLDLGGYFLSHFREVFNYYIFKYFLMPFLFVIFWDSMIRMLGHLTLFQRSLRLSSFLLILFFFFPLCFIYLLHSIFHLNYPTSASVILLLVPSRVVLISVIALFIID